MKSPVVNNAVKRSVKAVRMCRPHMARRGPAVMNHYWLFESEARRERDARRTQPQKGKWRR